jgi:hypothetical protein
VSKPLCVNWTDHFYNTKLRDNNFLSPIAPANTSLNITGTYEQTTGVLPVSGTNNVKGVTRFQVSFRVYSCQ